MDPRLAKVRDDLSFISTFFPPESFEFVRANRELLIRRNYTDAAGNGCLFNLLSRPLPADKRIDSRESLTRFFTGGHGEPYCECDVYQPAKWLVRLIDGESVDRYDGLDHVEWEFVLECLDEAIRQRLPKKTEPSPKQSRRRHTRSLCRLFRP